jgi:hypothetical protein
LQRIDLSHCKDIYADSICLLFMGCWDNITHLNLTACIFSEDFTRNFEVPKLKVLNLSYSSVDDRTLYAITKGCTGILKLTQTLWWGRIQGSEAWATKLQTTQRYQFETLS